MKLVKQDKLIEVIKKVSDLNDEAVLFVEKKKHWQSSSWTYVYEFDPDEIVPVKITDIPYFLEVSLVKEVIDVWKEWNYEKKSDMDICEAVIYYAENDAYKET